MDVLDAEQLNETDVRVTFGQTYRVNEEVSVARKDASVYFFFADDKLTEGRYDFLQPDIPFITQINSALRDFSDFQTLLEFKYGTANREALPVEFEELLELIENGGQLDRFNPYACKGLEKLWIDEIRENTDYASIYYVSDGIKSTWEVEGTTIELAFRVGMRRRPMDTESLRDAARVCIEIRYKDSQNWQQGQVWRREQWEAEQERRAEQEKRALLKGL